MFSLTKIATFATLTLGALSSVTAVPAVERRQGTDVVTVLDNLTSAVTPIAAQLATFSVDNATAGAITPIVNQITGLVSDAVSTLSSLPVGAVGNGNATQSLANVFTAILEPANTLITTPGIDTASIVPIFTQLGITLAALLQNVVRLVQEVLQVVVAILQGLITGLSGIVNNLGLGALSALGL
ncbi:hypothetical protein K488DRAFT_88471 [Vararia minispora EC-137]|uniref:Uncharacterized protein n=1 Tax=Vararia minispora EC-137 TaxID=1314806 RepID=A0ACB8QDJ8_9AGAM|nr:hypothetical protein K488DRAFT_88471 [Vararia minispora EC-137]